MQRVISTFIQSGGVFLLAVAVVLCLLNWAQLANSIQPNDPIFGIPLNYFFWIIGGISTAMAFICLFSERLGLSAILLCWLSINYLVYRAGLYWMGCHSLTGFLGGFPYAFGVSPGAANVMADIGFSYLLIGSSLAIWLGCRLPRAVELQKMACPSCGGRVKFASESLGQKIECPGCSAIITLRRHDETLKISCFFCKEHIEFSAHALGRKTECPHCKMEIGLKELA